jgi:hypothetical protein
LQEYLDNAPRVARERKGGESKEHEQQHE